MKTNCLTRQAMLFSAALATACGLSLSCSKDTIEGNTTGLEDPPAPELENQIEYNGGEWELIFSSIYEAEGDEYTFYLSPEENISSVTGMLETDNYLMVKVSSPDGEVDTATEDFEISYGKGLDISGNDLDKIEAIALSVAFNSETSVLTLSLDLTMNDKTTLKADFSRKCSPASLVELVNQYELDNVITSLGSAVALWSKADGTTYYLYEEENITETSEDKPADIVMHISDDLASSGTEIDLAAAVAQGQVQIDGPDGFSTVGGTAVEGKLTVGEEEISGDNILKLSLDMTVDGKRLRANYEKVCTRGYEASNTFTLSSTVDTQDPVTTTADLTRVFYYNDGTGAASKRIFMLGTAENPQNPEDLKTGNAIKLTVGGEGTSFSGEAFDIALYDYDSHMTTDKTTAGYKAVNGDIYVERTGNNTYLYFMIEFISNNSDDSKIVVTGEWFGELTAAEENTDLTPEKPFSPTITITSQGGETVFNAEIDRVEMRLENDYKLRGGADYGGVTLNAYFFYFVPKDTELSWQGVEGDRINVPMLMFQADKIPVEDELLAAKTDINWSMKYQKTGLQATEYCNTYESYGMTYGICPEDVQVTIVKNDKTWHIKFATTDSYLSSGYPSGSGNRLVIEWQGPLTMYSGSKTNDCDKADY